MKTFNHKLFEYYSHKIFRHKIFSNVICNDNIPSSSVSIPFVKEEKNGNFQNRDLFFLPSLGIYLKKIYKETFTSLLFKGKKRKTRNIKWWRKIMIKISGFNFSCLQTKYEHNVYMYIYIFFMNEGIRNSKKKLNNKFRKKREWMSFPFWRNRSNEKTTTMKYKNWTWNKENRTKDEKNEGNQSPVSL